MAWKSYGDVNFITEGGCVLDNSRAQEGIYRIVCCRMYDVNPDTDEAKFDFIDTEVDINDDWIDQLSVEAYSGSSCKQEDPEYYAACCLAYYGAEEFGAYYSNYFDNSTVLSRRQVETRIRESNVNFSEAGVHIEYLSK